MRNLTHHWLPSHPLGAKQGEVKGGRGSAPTRKINFISLVAYGPKVVLPNLSHGGLQLLQSGRVVPKNVFPAISQSIVLDHHLFLFLCYLNQTFGPKTIFTDYLLNAKVSRISLPQITIPSQFPDITMLKSNRHFKIYHPKGNF